MTRELDGVELGPRVAESPGWVNVAEDKNGHAIDADGNLIHDPRCYFCLNADIRMLAYVKVEIDVAQVAGGGSTDV